MSVAKLIIAAVWRDAARGSAQYHEQSAVLGAEVLTPAQHVTFTLINALSTRAGLVYTTERYLTHGLRQGEPFPEDVRVRG